MASIAILDRKCDGCKSCVSACAFGAISVSGGKAAIGETCRACGACVRACDRGAIIRLETRTKSVDKSKWRGILVFAEVTGERAHPVTFELIGEARKLARVIGQGVSVVLIGSNVAPCARELLHYGVENVYTYDSEELSYFRCEAFADCAADAIRHMKPCAVLIGATALGRSLAPRLATRFRTGLTADCTRLEMRENTDLVQIRPAFGGNIMAQIVTQNTRPQFATVRYKVMNSERRSDEPSGSVVNMRVPEIRSRVEFVSASPVPKAVNISDAEILVAAGRGLKSEGDLSMIKKLAGLLGGEWATSRPLAEKGWSTNARQIGLSGRTVKPKLIIACGISGAIQFTACMKASEHIVAVNTDPRAPIFDVAHVGIVGDLYDVIPELIRRIEEERAI